MEMEKQFNAASGSSSTKNKGSMKNKLIRKGQWCTIHTGDCCYTLRTVAAVVQI